MNRFVIGWAFAMLLAMPMAASAASFEFSEYKLDEFTVMEGLTRGNEAVTLHAMYDIGRVVHKAHKVVGFRAGLGGVLNTDGKGRAGDIHGAAGVCTPKGLLCGSAGLNLTAMHGFDFVFMTDAVMMFKTIGAMMPGATR